jgi:hypothetical protein
MPELLPVYTTSAIEIHQFNLVAVVDVHPLSFVQQLFPAVSHARMGSCMLNAWTDVILYLLHVHFLCQTRGAKGGVMGIVCKLHQIK